MSTNIELALITRVVDDKDFQSLEKAQINESFFMSPEAREVYCFLRDTYHSPDTMGLVPSREMVGFRFPGFFFFQANDVVPILVSQLKREKLRLGLLTLAQNVTLATEKDPMYALAELQAEMGNLQGFTENDTDLSMSSAYEMLLQNYETTQQSNGLLGIPYPWEVLNEETQGMLGGQFIVLYGRPGTMKSWLAIYMAVFAYQQARRRVLFYTREMPKLQVAMRTASAIARVDYKAFRSGKLQPDIKDYTFAVLKQLIDEEKTLVEGTSRQPYFKILHDKGSGGVAWLQAKIKETDPDLVIVDGMYLMRDDRGGHRNADWKSITHISQDLKLTAQSFNIPVIAVTQANRSADKAKGEDLTELAFSDAIGQDADAVYRVSKKDLVDEQSGRKRTELYLTSPKIREGKFDGIVINGVPATDFSFIRGITNNDNEPEDYNGGGSSKSSGGAPKGPSFRRKNASYMDPRIK